MGLFDKYRSVTRCGTSDAELDTEDMVHDIIYNWGSFRNAYLIYKNMDFETELQAIIDDERSYRRAVGEKKVIMYPFQTIQMGDYIHWKYGGDDFTNWLAVGSDKQYPFKETAWIKRCNNTLRWIDDQGILHEYPCVLADTFRDTDFTYTKYMTTMTGSVLCMVQNNDDTANIRLNKRFLFENNSFAKVGYKIRGIEDFLQDGHILAITLNVTPLAPDDDIHNFIANAETYQYSITTNDFLISQEVGFTGQLTATVTKNSDVVSVPLVWYSDDESIVTVDQNGSYELLAVGQANITVQVESNPSISETIIVDVVEVLPQNIDVRFTPVVERIFQDEVVTFTVNKYQDEVIQPDEFTIEFSGASGRYDTDIIDGNSFTVKSLGFSSELLNIKAISSEDGSEGQIQVQLRGYW